MPVALIAFDFDPFLRLGGIVVRWETLALAATIVLCVGLAAVLAGRTPAINEAFPEMGGKDRGAWHLRRDDLLFILLGVIPGAIVAGRIGYILLHQDFYGEHPEYWLDPGQGSLELSFAVVGGMAAGAAVAFALGTSVGRWLHVAVVPVLLGIGLGKLAMALGGSGQGIPTSDVTWSTAYLGPGPWASLAPAVPSHPAQIYEGVLTLIVVGLIGGLLLLGRFKDQDGRVFFAGLSLWAIARVEAGNLWRDPEVLGPFKFLQVVALIIAGVSLALFVWLALETGRAIRRIVAERAHGLSPAMVVAEPAMAAGTAVGVPSFTPVLATPGATSIAGGVGVGVAAVAFAATTAVAEKNPAGPLPGSGESSTSTTATNGPSEENASTAPAVEADNLAALQAAHDHAADLAEADLAAETINMLDADETTENTRQATEVPANPIPKGAVSAAVAATVDRAGASTRTAAPASAVPWYRAIRRRIDESPPARSGWLTATGTVEPDVATEIHATRPAVRAVPPPVVITRPTSWVAGQRIASARVVSPPLPPVAPLAELAGGTPPVVIVEDRNALAAASLAEALDRADLETRARIQIDSQVEADAAAGADSEAPSLEAALSAELARVESEQAAAKLRTPTPSTEIPSATEPTDERARMRNRLAAEAAAADALDAALAAEVARAEAEAQGRGPDARA